MLAERVRPAMDPVSDPQRPDRERALGVEARFDRAPGETDFGDVHGPAGAGDPRRHQSGHGRRNLIDRRHRPEPRLPDYNGNNLNALNDCLSDVAAGDYGADLGATGFVLVLRHYDRFAGVEKDLAHALLDIFASQARNALLVGHRMMCLVQSDDPRLSFPAVGATSALWNDAEWLNSRREL
ncbi:barstar family protein [Amycolatopsis sp. NPDC001319]|uniref:barstar family protein n=1 Tax=unclassified Amycolatopsis TaxID=2618356 RepID=UPI0036C1A11D